MLHIDNIDNEEATNVIETPESVAAQNVFMSRMSHATNEVVAEPFEHAKTSQMERSFNMQ